MTKSIRMQSGLWRLFSLFIIVLGLIVLMLVQGNRKPESSLSALEPVLPHAVAETFKDQSVLLNLPVEGVVVFVPPNAFLPPEGKVVVSITNSSQGDYRFTHEWMDYRELNIEFLDAKGMEHSILELEKPIEFCFSFSDEKSVQKKPGNFSLSELTYWEYVQEVERWRMISTYTLEEQVNSICGKSSLMTKYVLAGKKPISED